MSHRSCPERVAPLVLARRPGDEELVGLRIDAGAEAAADPVENPPQPFGVTGRRFVQSHLPGFHRHHSQLAQFVGARVEGHQVEQTQVVAEAFVPPDAS